MFFPTLKKSIDFQNTIYFSHCP